MTDPDRGMSKTSFFWPDYLNEAVKQEAARTGVSVSEYIRTSLIVRLTWTRAMQAVVAGADPSKALDTEEFTRAVNVMARELARE